MVRKNIYKHSIELKKLRIVNAPRDEFAEELKIIDYRGYEVEDIDDGRKIVIAKPGGKKVYGKPLKEDYFVYVFDPKNETLWQITHKQIKNDLDIKSLKDSVETLKILKVLEKVYNGEEPDFILSKVKLTNPEGEDPEVLIKAYKWIWGQEDVNYPTGLGRRMSFEGIDPITLKKTGNGIEDLIKNLKISNQ
jgi:hypothetical protein